MKTTVKNIPQKKALWLLVLAFCSIQVHAQQGTDPTQNIPGQLPPALTAATPYPALVTLTATNKFNYIKTTVPDVPLQSLPASSYYCRIVTDYYDGLGRPLQTVAQKSHSGGNDIVTPHVYDSLGRETYQYLPFAATIPVYSLQSAQFGKLKPNVDVQLRGFYDQAGFDEEPYSKTVFENSPLNRVVKQMSPGKSWVGSGKGITYDYKTNAYPTFTSLGNVSTKYIIKGAFPKFTIGNGNTDLPQVAGEYEPGELYITSVKDEDGKLSEEIKDKSGRVVMKRSLVKSNAATPLAVPDELFPEHYAYTHYVYNDLGQLRAVIPPAALTPVSVINTTGITLLTKTYTYTWPVLTTEAAKGLCYTYCYDERGRTTEKKIPGKEVEYFVYDKRDRVIFSQDGNMRKLPQPIWAFTIYDALDRPCVTGFADGPASREVLVAWAAWYTSNSPNDVYFYINNYNSYHPDPASLNSCKINSYTYFDDYSNLSAFSFDASQFSSITIPSDNTVVQPQSSASGITRGLVTGSRTLVLDPSDPNGSTWLYSVNYYDDKGRIIQTQSQNLKGGVDISSNVYYFQGMLYKNILRHRNPDAKVIPGASDGAITQYTVQNTFQRNLGISGGNDQVWKHTQKINAGIDYQLAYYDYDHLGRVVVKQFPAGSQLQAYNIRGFLKNIDFKDVNSAALDTLFEEKLFYDNGFTNKLYNGNIAGITWRGQDKQEKAYGYSYDNLNRLTHAEFRQKNANVWDKTQDFTAANITYDLNGNIKTMNQMVTTQNTSAPVTSGMDVLKYTYAANSNRLINVQDNGTEDPLLPDFKDGANHANTNIEEYGYDANGNLTKDDNKKISAIEYNYLNKPAKIIVAGKGEIWYTYDAAGNKLRKKVTDYTDASKNEDWDYIGNFVYKNNELQYILNEEGRARPIAASGSLVDPGSATAHPTKFVYDYFVKDHLGNVRSTVTANPITYQYLAKHEIASANVEQLVFDNIPSVREVKPGSLDPHDGMAARLDGGNPATRIGTAILLKANVGDRFQISADAFYDGDYKQAKEATANDLVTSLVGALTGGTNYAGVPIAELPQSAKLANTLLGNPTLATGIKRITETGNNPNAPKAHLNYLWFNDKMQLDISRSGSIQVPSNINGTGGWVTLAPAGGSINGVISGGTLTPHHIQPGFLLVYIDNQSIGKSVWFDNVRIGQYTSSVVEEDHYYPYGLCYNTKEAPTNIAANNKKYQGIELEKHFGLETYETLYRGLDPQLGRFNQIDPKTELDYSLSPFVSMRNNPAYNIDPFGDVAGDFIDKNGKNIGNDGKNDGKVYVVKTTETDFDSGVPSAGITKDQSKATTSFIESNSGNTEAFKSNSIAYDNSVEIEGGAATRQGMVDIAKSDNGGEPSNHQEYGAAISNTGVVGPKETGPANLPGQEQYSQVEITTDANTRSIMHSHQSYFKEEGKATAGTIQVSSEIKTKSFNQAPSDRDINNAGTKTNYVFGMRNSTVYIYNNQGVQATVPLKRFVEPKK